MSIISIEQFEELSEAYPELAECYDLDSTFTKDAATNPYMEEPIAYTN
jgi:hypothetical protein